MEPTNFKDHTIRVFVALPIPEHIAEELEIWTHTNKERLPFRKWTHRKDYHITLQFLGETSLVKLEALQAALRNVRATPFSLSLNGVGFFGSPKAPRVLWTAVSGNLKGLNFLHSAVIQATHTLGYVHEDRPYASHITLARDFAVGKEISMGAITSAPVGAEWEADQFILMRTHMKTSPMYEVIDNYSYNLQ
ncbi:MAG: RNA 2',3'-cyclic phosphodiesterase [Paenibacillaceae bacterium]